MDVLMEAADVLVGKGGGLTVSESLAKHTPMIVFEAVPGQETRNASVLEKEGAGLVADSLEDAIAKVESLAKDPSKLEALRHAAQRMARPRAARHVAELALGAR
jgi:processive 1,2-diacylglycerol beta-glucosyltransferase